VLEMPGPSGPKVVTLRRKETKTRRAWTGEARGGSPNRTTLTVMPNGRAGGNPAKGLGGHADVYFDSRGRPMAFLVQLPFSKDVMFPV
jgi:hypothetical protein